jgi:hypothetical protein
MGRLGTARWCSHTRRRSRNRRQVDRGKTAEDRIVIVVLETSGVEVLLR